MSALPPVRDLNKLNTFVRVVEHRSFTGAARDLRVTPSLASKHVRELEQFLGLALLSRSTHGVALTQAGETFFESCLRMLEELDAAIVRARDQSAGASGTLRVQVSSGFARSVVAPLVSKFTARYPRIALEVSVPTSTKNPFEDGYDIVIAGRRPTGLGVLTREVSPIRHVICAAPSYLREFGEPLYPSDLKQHNCLTNCLFAPKEWPFKQDGRTTSIEISGKFCSNSSAVLASAAVDGIGITRVPYYSVREHLASGSLVELFSNAVCSNEHMLIFYPRNRFIPEKIIKFIEFIREKIE